MKLYFKIFLFFVCCFSASGGLAHEVKQIACKSARARLSAGPAWACAQQDRTVLSFAHRSFIFNGIRELRYAPVAFFCVKTKEQRNSNGNLVFDKNGDLEYILFGEGRIVKDNNEFVFEYHLKDHLGSTRVAFVPENGTKTVVQENAYYPFGAPIADLSYVGSSDNIYKREGKEYITDFDWNKHDYGGRTFDLWALHPLQLDPMAEKYYGMSPYSLFANNPVSNIDPDGRDWREFLKKLFGLDNLLGQTPDERIANAEKREAINKAVTEVGEKLEPLAKAEAKVIETVFPVVGNMFVKNMQGAEILVGDVAVDIGIEVGFSMIPGGKLLKEGAEAVAKKAAKEVGGEVANAYSKGTFKSFEKQLLSGGKDRLLKSQTTIRKNLAEHIEKLEALKNAGGYTSSVEREIRTFQSQLNAINDLLNK